MRLVLIVVAVLGSTLGSAALRADTFVGREGSGVPKLVAGLADFSGEAPGSETFALRHARGFMVDGITSNGVRLWGLLPDRAAAERVQLWGLRITDHGALRRWLQDRTVRCVYVLTYQGATYLDCDAAAEPIPLIDAPAARGNWINLITWLPELGYAEPDCGEAELSQPQSTQVGGAVYGCIEGRPMRTFWSERTLWEIPARPNRRP